MDIGLKLRDSAKQKRRTPGQTGGRALRPAGNKSGGDKPKQREDGRPSLWSIIGDAVHGVVFLGLTAAALIHFGQVFDIVCAVSAVLSIMSLKEAWTGLRNYLGK
jgi:hypothetical protein